MGVGPVKPQSGPFKLASVREFRTLRLKSPQRTTGSAGRARPSAKTAARSSSASARRLSEEPVAWRLPTTNIASPRPRRTTWQTRRSFPHARRAAAPSPRCRASARRKRNELRTRCRCSSTRRSGARRIAFACPVKAERKRPWSSSVMSRPSSALDRNGPIRGRSVTSAMGVIPLQASSRSSDHRGSSCKQRTAGRSALASPTISLRNALLVGGCVFPWKRFQVRTSRRSTVLPMRIVLADPPGFTPAYDHELAAGLAARGLDVELVTSRFRFGETPSPSGYRRSEPFYPLSSRVFHRSPLRIPFKLVEHIPGTVSLLRRPADVLHLQWLAAPELDRFLLRARVPTVFTAHDLVPRRTAKKQALWRQLLSRFD